MGYVHHLRSCKMFGVLHNPPVTLAIGDGANDVAMIREAHVGVVCLLIRALTAGPHGQGGPPGGEVQ